MAARTLLCFGDSNTHGTPGDDPDYVRLPPDARWPGRLRTLLPGWTVIEEGLNGRTVDSDYPDRPGLNGRSYLIPCLLSHNPLDAIVLMLGTNDLKTQFALSVERLAAQWGSFLDDLHGYAFAADGSPPLIVLMSPIHLDPTQPQYADAATAFDADSVAKSHALATAYAAIAKRRGLLFLDAATVASAGADGIHLTADGHAVLAEAVGDVLAAEPRLAE